MLEAEEAKEAEEAEGAPLQKEMTNRYSTQLHYYTMAIESIKRVHVKEKVLYLYDIGQELAIE